MPAASALQRAASGGQWPALQEICSVTGMDAGSVANAGTDRSKQGNAMDVCGYCSLAAHTPLLTTPALALPAMLRVAAPVLTLPQYVYFPPRPFHGRTHPLDPPPFA